MDAKYFYETNIVVENRSVLWLGIVNLLLTNFKDVC